MIRPKMENALSKAAECANLFKRLRVPCAALIRTARRLRQPARAVCAVLIKAAQAVPHFA